MNLLRRLFRRKPDPALLAVAGKIDDLESRLHHQEVQIRNLLARLSAVEGDVAWICRPGEQTLPEPVHQTGQLDTPATGT